MEKKTIFTFIGTLDDSDEYGDITIDEEDSSTNLTSFLKTLSLTKTYKIIIEEL